MEWLGRSNNEQTANTSAKQRKKTNNSRERFTNFIVLDSSPHSLN